MVAVVDDDDFDFLNQWKWNVEVSECGRHYYAVRHVTVGTKQQDTIRMHRQIMQVSDGVLVDHCSRNTLDNQKTNLRVCNKSQNGSNAEKRCDNKSGFKGVHWHLRVGKWAVQIQIEKRRTHVGYFDNVIDAAKAYDNAAIKSYGVFAATNKSLGLIP